MADFDAVVIGAGVVGLAVARELAKAGGSVLVIERHRGIGEETSSRNSEVIHAGIYYPQGSFKARMCVAGRDMLYAYCSEKNIEHKRVGKLIVARGQRQLEGLKGIYEKALTNGVADVRYVEQEELVEIEPALQSDRAILSPSTGIINSHELMLALQGDMEDAGGVIVLATPFVGGVYRGSEFIIRTGGEDPAEISASALYNCGGLSAWDVAGALEGMPQDRIPPRYLSKGCYFSLSGKTPFSRLIYPLPNEVGLGTHLTLDLQGRARFGPDTRWIDRIDYQVEEERVGEFYRAVREYYPALADGQLIPAYSGIRPKIVGPGAAAADFMVQYGEEFGMPGWVSLYGIESPGLTSCLALAQYVADVKK